MNSEKFAIDWNQYKQHPSASNVVAGAKEIAATYRAQLLDLTIEVEHLIQEELAEDLFNLTMKLQKAVAATDAMGPGENRTEQALDEAAAQATRIIAVRIRENI